MPAFPFVPRLRFLTFCCGSTGSAATPHCTVTAGLVLIHFRSLRLRLRYAAPRSLLHGSFWLVTAHTRFCRSFCCRTVTVLTTTVPLPTRLPSHYGSAGCGYRLQLRIPLVYVTFTGLHHTHTFTCGWLPWLYCHVYLRLYIHDTYGCIYVPIRFLPPRRCGSTRLPLCHGYGYTRLAVTCTFTHAGYTVYHGLFLPLRVWLHFTVTCRFLYLRFTHLPFRSTTLHSLCSSFTVHVVAGCHTLRLHVLHSWFTTHVVPCVRRAHCFAICLVTRLRGCTRVAHLVTHRTAAVLVLPLIRYTGLTTPFWLLLRFTTRTHRFVPLPRLHTHTFAVRTYCRLRLHATAHVLPHAVADVSHAHFYTWLPRPVCYTYRLPGWFVWFWFYVITRFWFGYTFWLHLRFRCVCRLRLRHTLRLYTTFRHYTLPVYAVVTHHHRFVAVGYTATAHTYYIRVLTPTRHTAPPVWLRTAITCYVCVPRCLPAYRRCYHCRFLYYSSLPPCGSAHYILRFLRSAFGWLPRYYTAVTTRIAPVVAYRFATRGYALPAVLAGYVTHTRLHYARLLRLHYLFCCGSAHTTHTVRVLRFPVTCLTFAVTLHVTFYTFTGWLYGYAFRLRLLRLPAFARYALRLRFRLLRYTRFTVYARLRFTHLLPPVWLVTQFAHTHALRGSLPGSTVAVPSCGSCSSATATFGSAFGCWVWFTTLRLRCRTHCGYAVALRLRLRLRSGSVAVRTRYCVLPVCPHTTLRFAHVPFLRCGYHLRLVYTVGYHA